MGALNEKFTLQQLREQKESERKDAIVAIKNDTDARAVKDLEKRSWYKGTYEPPTPKLVAESPKSATAEGEPSSGSSTPGDADIRDSRRRLAQREHSNRRDSPVMVRLLHEIVTAI